VKIIGDYVELKYILLCKMPKSVYCSYNANYKLMIVKHAEEKNCP